MLVAFDGTDAELFDSSGDSNVVRFSDRYRDETRLETHYLPGPGTRLSALGYVLGGAIGMGWRSRVREAVNMACHIAARDRNEPIDGIGFSRGGIILYRFARQFYEKTGRPLRFFGAFDAVDSILLDVLKRALPRKVWYPPRLERPPAQHVFHVTGPAPPGLFKGGKPSARWFVPTHIEGAEMLWLKERGMAHSYRGRSDEALEWMWAKFIEATSRPSFHDEDV